MNCLVIVGNLGKDPEAFAYKGDQEGARFSVAVKSLIAPPSAAPEPP